MTIFYVPLRTKFFPDTENCWFGNIQHPTDFPITYSLLDKCDYVFFTTNAQFRRFSTHRQNFPISVYKNICRRQNFNDVNVWPWLTYILTVHNEKSANDNERPDTNVPILDWRLRPSLPCEYFCPRSVDLWYFHETFRHTSWCFLKAKDTD